MNRYEEERQVTIDYTNYRGETSTRRIFPVKLYWGTSPYHLQPQWLLKAIDVEKDLYRDFAVCSIHNLRLPEGIPA